MQSPEEMEPYEYEHALFPPGTPVYITPDIIALHPLSRIAGKYSVACTGTIYPLLAPFEDQYSRVPVVVDGHIWYAEEDYVRRVER